LEKNWRIQFKQEMILPRAKGKEVKELSIIIVNYNTKAPLSKTLEAIHKNLKDLDYEIVVVDNASSDGSAESIKKYYPSVKLIALDYNAGFAKGNNEGARHASGRYLLILNHDTYAPKGSVEKLITIKKSFPEYGIVAPLIFNPDKSLQLSWGKDLHIFSELFLKYFLEKLFRIHFKLKKGEVSRNVDWASGACFLIERELYERIGGFDENFFIYIEDADLGRRIRRLGYQIHLTSEVDIIHYLGQSTSKYPRRSLLEAKKSQLYYYCKHNSKVALRILRFYLLIRFFFKRLIYYFKGDSEECETCEKVLSVIREFNCEDYS